MEQAGERERERVRTRGDAHKGGKQPRSKGKFFIPKVPIVFCAVPCCASREDPLMWYSAQNHRTRRAATRRMRDDPVRERRVPRSDLGSISLAPHPNYTERLLIDSEIWTDNSYARDSRNLRQLLSRRCESFEAFSVVKRKGWWGEGICETKRIVPIIFAISLVASTCDLMHCCSELLIRRAARSAGKSPKLDRINN